MSKIWIAGLALAMAGCSSGEGEIYSVEELLASEQTQTIALELNGFSGESYTMHLDMGAGSVDGEHVLREVGLRTEGCRTRHSFPTPARIPTDTQIAIREALATTVVGELDEDACEEASADETIYDGDFPSITIGERRFSSYPNACSFVRDDGALFRKVLDAFEWGGPFVHYVRWNGSDYEIADECAPIATP